MQEETPKIIVLMVDGFGVPSEGWSSSVFHKYGGENFTRLFENYSHPIDACLGVEGIPQSATGQSSIFCGINAPKLMGRHIQGFPREKLREIIRAKNIFRSFQEHDKKVSFANAYVHYTIKELESMGAQSVTTVMTMSTIGNTLLKDDLICGKALYHDITRASIDARHGIPRISPTEAAGHLISLAASSDLTLFEYFLTDRAGHKCDETHLAQIISELSEFICTLSEKLPSDMLILMTSDHGNCENMSDKRHTCNPVPLMVLGRKSESLKKLESISDIHDALINIIAE